MQKSLGKAHKVLALTLITLVASIFMAGCQMGPAAPSKPADQVIKDGITKLTAISSYSYDVKAVGDLKDGTGAGANFNVGLSGQVDFKDAKDPKVTLMVDGTVTDNKQMNGAGTIDMRLNKDAFYFNVLKFNLTGYGDIPKDVTDMFAKWWKITLPAQTAEELVNAVPQGEAGKLTPEQQKMQQLISETNFFSKPTYVGVENVKGEDCYHYSVTLDKQALLDFLKKAGEAQGQTISDTDMADAKAAFDKITATGDIYIGTQSAMMQKLVANVTVTNTDTTKASGTFTVTLQLWDVGKPVTLDVPKDAAEFPVQQFLGPMMNAESAVGSDTGTTGTETLPTTDISTEQLSATQAQ